MNTIWEELEETFLCLVKPETFRGKQAPANSRVFAFRPDGSMCGLWFGGEMIRWGNDMKPSRLLMARTDIWTLHFAVRSIFPASYPKRSDVFMLGASAIVDVYPGAGLSLLAFQQETGLGDTVKYRNVYPAFQREMEEIWRTIAQEYCGGSAWPRSCWLSRMTEILKSVRAPVTLLLLKYGLNPVGDIKLGSLAPIAVRRPEWKP